MFLFPWSEADERELWCEGNRWDGGDCEGVTTWMQPVGTIAVSTCISSLSGNISLVLLSAIKALSNLGWLVGVSRWWGVGWCMSKQWTGCCIGRTLSDAPACKSSQPGSDQLYFFNPITSPDGRLKISPFSELQIINCQTMYFGNLLGQCHDIQWVNDLEVYDFPVLMDFFFISLPPFVNVQPHRMWTSRQ